MELGCEEIGIQVLLVGLDQLAGERVYFFLVLWVFCSMAYGILW